MTTFIVTADSGNSEEVQRNLRKLKGVRSVRLASPRRKKSISDSLVSESSLAKDWGSKEDVRWDEVHAAAKKKR